MGRRAVAACLHRLQAAPGAMGWVRLQVASLAPRVATVRVLHEVAGRRQVVSHFNKATKGRLVRALLEDGRDPRTPAALAAVLTELGWRVETDEPTKKGTQLDVIVSEV